MCCFCALRYKYACIVFCFGLCMYMYMYVKFHLDCAYTWTLCVFNCHLHNICLQHLRTLVGHTGGVWCSEFNGVTVVSGSTDRTLRVWHSMDVKNVASVYIYVHVHTCTYTCTCIYNVCFSKCSVCMYI